MEAEKSSRTNKILLRALQVLISLLFQFVVLWLSAGTLAWQWMWVFLIVYMLGILFVAQLFIRKIPDTIARRSETSGMKNWDKLIGGLWGFTHFILLLAVAGLDFRFGWSAAFPLWLQEIGLLIFVIGFAIFCWSLYENAYFSTVVRVQAQEGQSVCTSGPYQFVRHPGYTGACLQSLGLALLLGSWWALLPATLSIALMVLRAKFEDRTLQAELPGYIEFAEKTKYRLLPWVW